MDFIPRSTKSSVNIRKGQFSSLRKPIDSISINQSKPSIKFTLIESENHNNITNFVQQNGYTNNQQQYNMDRNQLINQTNILDNLDSKYKIYKNGTPNHYSYNIQTLKANNIKSHINTLDLPFIDNVIKQLKSSSSSNNLTHQINTRDLQKYPNLLKTHQTYKFKQLLSDKQQMKDFLKWFQKCYLIIDNKKIPNIKRFQQKQIVISAAFNQITQHMSKLSKSRSEILKMLWNKECNQVEEITSILTSKVIQLQKTHLQTLSTVHLSYQEEIQQLKKNNILLQKKLEQQTFLNNSFIHTLRCDRKTMRKYEIFIKKIIQKNQNLRRENLNLLDENTKMIINNTFILNDTNDTLNHNINKYKQNNNHSHHNKTTIINKNNLQQDSPNINNNNKNNNELKQINFTNSRLLLYRRLQIAQFKKQLYLNKGQASNKLIKQVKQNNNNSNKINSNKSNNNNNNTNQKNKQNGNKRLNQNNRSSQLSQQQQQLFEKKSSLYQFLLQRFKQYPQQRIFLKDQYLHDHLHGTNQDEQINQNQAFFDHVLNQIFKTKELEIILKNQNNKKNNVNSNDNDKISSIIDDDIGIRQIGVNTTGCLKIEEQLQVNHKHTKHNININNNNKNTNNLDNNENNNSNNKNNNNHNINRSSLLKNTLIINNNNNNSCKLTGSTNNTNKRFSILGIQQSKLIEQKLQRKVSQIKNKARSSLLNLKIQHLNIINAITKQQNKQNKLHQQSNVTNNNNPHQQGYSQQQQSISSQSQQIYSISDTNSLNKINSSNLSKVLESPLEVKKIQQAIVKYNNKNNSKKTLKHPQKYVDKIVTSVWMKVMEMIKVQQQINNNNTNHIDSHSTIPSIPLLCIFSQSLQSLYSKNPSKSIQSKLLSLTSIFNQYESHHQLFSICSIFFNISNKFSQYSHLIKNDVVSLYFEMYRKLIVKDEGNYENLNNNGTVWMAKTNLNQLRSKDTVQIVQKYFSKMKIIQIFNRIQEMIGYCNVDAIGNTNGKRNTINTNNNGRNTINTNNNKNKKVLDKLTVSQEIDQYTPLPLNSLLLYLIQSYLIQKQTYYLSYSKFIQFFAKKQQRQQNINIKNNELFLSIQQLRLLLKLFNLSQFHLLKFNLQYEHQPDSDIFYRICLLDDISLLDQKSIQIQCTLKQIPESFKHNFQINVPSVSDEYSIEEKNKWKYVYNQMNSKIVQQGEEIIRKGLLKCITKMDTFLFNNKNKQQEDIQVFSLVYKFLLWYFYGKEMKKSIKISQEVLKDCLNLNHHHSSSKK